MRVVNASPLINSSRQAQGCQNRRCRRSSWAGASSIHATSASWPATFVSILASSSTRQRSRLTKSSLGRPRNIDRIRANKLLASFSVARLQTVTYLRGARSWLPSDSLPVTTLTGGRRTSFVVDGAIGAAGGTRQKPWTPKDGRRWRPPGGVCCRTRPRKRRRNRDRAWQPKLVPTAPRRSGQRRSSVNTARRGWPPRRARPDTTTARARRRGPRFRRGLRNAAHPFQRGCDGRRRLERSGTFLWDRPNLATDRVCPWDDLHGDHPRHRCLYDTRPRDSRRRCRKRPGAVKHSASATCGRSGGLVVGVEATEILQNPGASA